MTLKDLEPRQRLLAIAVALWTALVLWLWIGGFLMYLMSDTWGALPMFLTACLVGGVVAYFAVIKTSEYNRFTKDERFRR